MGNRTKITHEQIHSLHVQYRMPNTQIAKLLGVDEASVRRAVKRYKEEYSYLVDVRKVEHLRDSLDQPIQLHNKPGGNIAITADYHIPVTDMELFNTFLSTAKRQGAEECVIGGDWWNADADSKYFPKQLNISKPVEQKYGNYMMKKLLEVFATVKFIRGNHDYRYVVGRNYSITFVEAMQEMFAPLGNDINRIEFSNLDHLHLYNAGTGQKFLVCHPMNYSNIPGTVALKLAMKYPGWNIITAHSHHCALMYDKSGQQMCVEIGGFHDASSTQYLQSTSTFPVWTNGFGMLNYDDGFILYPGNRKWLVENQLNGLSTGLVLP